MKPGKAARNGPFTRQTAWPGWHVAESDAEPEAEPEPDELGGATAATALVTDRPPAPPYASQTVVRWRGTVTLKGWRRGATVEYLAETLAGPGDVRMGTDGRCYQRIHLLTVPLTVWACTDELSDELANLVVETTATVEPVALLSPAESVEEAESV